MNWKRVLHHRYLGTIVGTSSLGWFIVQMARHEAVLAPLLTMMAGWLWVLDDVLIEDYGWKTPSYRIEQELVKFPIYVKFKNWIEDKAGGDNGIP